MCSNVTIIRVCVVYYLVSIRTFCVICDPTIFFVCKSPNQATNKWAVSPVTADAPQNQVQCKHHAPKQTPIICNKSDESLFSAQ